MMIYPCIASFTIFTQSYRYLRYSNSEITEKKTIVESMIIATIGLATPWIIVLFFISIFLSLSFWVDYIVVIASYIAIFFIAIDLPYFQSRKKLRRKKWIT